MPDWKRTVITLIKSVICGCTKYAVKSTVFLDFRYSDLRHDRFTIQRELFAEPALR